MKDQKILVTGPTGQVAGPIASHLAKDNEVWATARFTDESKKTGFEAEGITCVKSDLGTGDFSALPDDFDYVLHFACSRTPDFETDIRANSEGVGLLMSHCRKAKGFLACSTTGVYEADDHNPFTEASALGDNHRVMMPTYSISKIGAEVVARFAAREFNLALFLLATGKFQPSFEFGELPPFFFKTLFGSGFSQDQVLVKGSVKPFQCLKFYS